MNNYNKTVLGKILTAVESGGQKYGQGDWGNVIRPIQIAVKSIQ